MTTATLAYRVKQGRESALTLGINWKIACFTLFFACLCLLAFYVWQVNYLTKGTYLINSYEKQVLQLSKEQKELEVIFAESGFLGQVQAKIKDLNFQKTTSVKYIQIPDNSLATTRN